jgi:hypothetical protein
MITTAQLAAATAGGDDFIRTFNGQVMGLALRLDLNPTAPEVIIVGKGVRREQRARLVEAHQLPIPTYIKRGTNAWEHIGDYGPFVYRTDNATVQRLVKYRLPNSVAGGLYLSDESAISKAASNDNARARNGGFPDAKTRKEIEEAAIGFVTKSLEASGYKVDDHQKLNLGYDLRGTIGSKTLFIEVKGTDAEFPRFFLSRNEYNCSLLQRGWQLRVVCEARRSPRMHVFSATEMEKRFAFSPMAWECTPK